MRPAKLLAVSLLLVLALAAVASPAQASPQPTGVEHLMSRVGQTEVNTVHVAPGAQAVIKLAPLPGGGATVAWACQRLQAYVCVNGDFFNLDGSLVGGMVSDGQLLRAVPPLAPSPPGQEPDHQQLLLSKNGCFGTAPALPNDAWQSSGASYMVLRSGQLTAIQVANDINHFVYGHHSRTLVGWRVRPDGSCDSWFITISAAHFGVNLADAGRICQSVGATDCVNLDGGSSTAMSLGGQLVSPLQDGKEHAVHNVWAVIPVAPPPPPKPPPVVTTTVTVPAPARPSPPILAAITSPLAAQPQLTTKALGPTKQVDSARPEHGTLLATTLWLSLVGWLGQRKNRTALKRLGTIVYQGWA
ncbi:MAG TPA: phosphodiester glycosidase family protein [Candidatus Nanoarchaeia archaeon]|nr:phosphodiester glycosidase family protein [Candidatus Nanoarchaeia archaeon]